MSKTAACAYATIQREVGGLWVARAYDRFGVVQARRSTLTRWGARFAARRALRRVERKRYSVETIYSRRSRRGTE